jgi:hypothetical protein
MRRRHLLAGAILLMTANAGTSSAADPENTLVIDLSTGGRVVIELFPDVAPKHVARI